MRQINKHITHCSASPATTTVEDIRKWHVEENKWIDIGYHFIITQDGKIHFCRPVEIIGAHCYGKNSDSIGTCLIGNKTFTAAQLFSLQILHDLLKGLYNVNMTIHGHNEFSNKTCPNFEVKQFIKE